MIIEMQRCPADLWRMFRQHHYKDKYLNGACSKNCYVGIYEGRPVVFTAIVPSPGLRLANLENAPYKVGSDTYKDIQTVREHRTVVLPDFQGLGIGPRFSDAVAYYVSKMTRKCFYSKSVHPRFGSYRDRSTWWVPNGTNHRRQNKRKVYSHHWIGPKNAADIKKLQMTRFVDKNEDLEWLTKRQAR